MTERPAPSEPSTTVYRLDDDCTVDDLEEGALYHAAVDGLVDYGMFVRLADAVSGLAHESNYRGQYDEGEELVVELVEIRDDGDLSFVPADPTDVETVAVTHEYDPVPVPSLGGREGDTVDLDGEVVQIKQTAGPTLFHVSDGAGVVPCAAFERAGVRAYPDVSVGDAVHVIGRVDEGDHGRQVEVDVLDVLAGDRGADVHAAVADTLAAHAAPRDVDPLVEWSLLDDMRGELEAAATRLRRAILEGRPVVIRHHADTDGICASVPVSRALEAFAGRTHASPDAPQHLVKRFPSRAPYYELEDVTRDLSHALHNASRHGHRHPVLLMIDNGSTAEDVPAFEHLEAYDIPVVVIDHHHPDPDAVGPFVDSHVNPYLHGGDYRMTTGMLCAELARMIDDDVGERIRHLPAIAGLADHSAADAMVDYLGLAADEGFDEADLRDIGDAIDYAAYWLRYGDGRGLIDDVLGTREDGADHGALVDLLSSRATADIDRQLDDVLPHVTRDRLGNDVTCYRVDLDRHAHRFTYPAPGTTTGAIHDRKVDETREPAITIGYGPDFAVLRSDGVRLDIPEMVTELNEEIAGAGVSGGGHLVVGSIRFVAGMREPVLDALVGKMADAEIDETLGATAPRDYGAAVR